MLSSVLVCSVIACGGGEDVPDVGLGGVGGVPSAGSGAGGSGGHTGGSAGSGGTGGCAAAAPSGECNACYCSNGEWQCEMANSCVPCLYNGMAYLSGSTFQLDDGCNTCTCFAGGVTCTQMTCESGIDAGAMSDAGDVGLFDGGPRDATASDANLLDASD